MTFCAWYAGSTWTCGQLEFPEGTYDGTEELLSTIFTDVDEYAQWVEDYYERTPDVALLAEIFAGKKIDADVIASLNPDRKEAKALKELEPLQA